MRASYWHYDMNVPQSLWAWADRGHSGELDGGRLENRPPGLAVGHALKAILRRHTPFTLPYVANFPLLLTAGTEIATLQS